MKVIRIERTVPRKGVVEEPYISRRGYKLGDPKFGDEKHEAKNATFVKTLEEVADLIDKGFSLWMTAKGKRPSLISPASLRVIRSS